jgi:glycosyltransferase involved in cell wall biosynthesis
MSELSVVLISKDQEWNIARLIESILRETVSIPATEIVLVDSASTDQTTEIAARYPISVLKLRPDQRLSAAAGRYVGSQNTSGDLVLFLDGDMELCEGWLGQALALMRSRPDAAVICGQIIDRPKSERAPALRMPEPVPGEIAAVEVSQGGGASLYRRAVLEQVGTFNPYLYGEEEPSLCLRILHAGYRVLRLLRPIAFHYTDPAEDLLTFQAKRRGNLWLGYGQNIRYFLGSPLLLPYLRERGWAVAPAVMLSIGIIAAAAWVLTGQWRWLALWGSGAIMLALGITIRKRSLKRALLALLRRLLILDGTVRGFFLKPYDPSGYPGRYELIRSQYDCSRDRIVFHAHTKPVKKQI